ncbi:succinate dehydrogenase cytochrome b subunit [Streptomyces sp. SID3343]|uniref:succinate dehydrogenase cytochrome b subunit n=1 Tax=Streptomyces sp. SID3343 TaxID=2690260 RepID=UPI00136FD4BB|nr:succinate dehydrogenase cytochrome b subunit [Streptomyces sp. SID3343]MYV98944.1 succinate dehydrogenase [Streptomyces sp. SID3343]
MATLTRAPASRRGRQGASHRSTVMMKIAMAVSGAVLLAYVTAHMVGNLKIFFGESSFDHYAHWLRTIGMPLVPREGFLWLVRAGLSVAVVVHIVMAVLLTRRARRARPVKYVHRPPVQGSYAARTMRWGGVIIALFVVYHILDLTVGVANPVGASGKPYTNVNADFDHWYITAIYTVAVIALGFHLRHGLWSATRTLGRQRPGSERMFGAIATGYAVLVTAGFLSVPLAVSFGIVG